MVARFFTFKKRFFLFFYKIVSIQNRPLSSVRERMMRALGSESNNSNNNQGTRGNIRYRVLGIEWHPTILNIGGGPHIGWGPKTPNTEYRPVLMRILKIRPHPSAALLPC